MGKRGEGSPVPVSARVQAIVDRAKQNHGNQKETPRPNPRPQATPARAASPSSKALLMTTPPKPMPAASPMSTSSTPLKSPDTKRHRSASSLSLTSTPSEVPSLPSFTASSANRPRHTDSSTTISLQQYMAEMTLDKGQNPMKCNHFIFKANTK